MADLFGPEDLFGQSRDQLSVIPVSVLDVYPQREGEDHDGDSSRSGYSPFPKEVALICAEFYLRDAGVVV